MVTLATVLSRPVFWPRTLRSRLTLSHAGVLLVALLVIMLMSTWVLAHESRRLHIEQLQDLAVPLLVETNYANRTQGSKYGLLPMPIEEALRQQAVSMGIRVLLIDPDGSVQLDTEVERSLKGQRISAFVEPLADLQADAEPEDGIVRSEAVPEQGEPNPLAGYRVVMAVDARPPDSALFVAAPPTRPEAVERLSTRYGIALATAIGVAALAGLMMSKAVSAPVSALAAAADAMARGDFAQHVPGEGPDESDCSSPASMPCLGPLPRSTAASGRCSPM